MDPVLAKQIALGDIDPVTLLPMEDINPCFVPLPLKSLPLSANSARQSPKNKGKVRASSGTGGILRFFGWFSFVSSVFCNLPLSFLHCRTNPPATSSDEAKHTTRSLQTKSQRKGQWEKKACRGYGSRYSPEEKNSPEFITFQIESI